MQKPVHSQNYSRMLPGIRYSQCAVCKTRLTQGRGILQEVKFESCRPNYFQKLRITCDGIDQWVGLFWQNGPHTCTSVDFSVVCGCIINCVIMVFFFQV